MNELNRLDPVRMLDAEARRSSGGTPPTRFLFVVCSADRALFVLSELGGMGWRVTRSRREASLEDGRVIHVLTANRVGAMRGCRIAGYLADEDVALSLSQRMALMPMMLGNRPAEAAAHE